jgi:DivIVA domain-containing protein
MAISFSRPDPSSPTAVSTASFSTGRRGYEPEEVREFLRMVAAELARLQEREKFLERELRMAQRSAPSPAIALDEEVVTRMLGEEAARILSTARDAASQIKTRAEEGAARLLRDATDEAQRLREEAELESVRRRQDAASDADSELQMAKQQGREMVNEARAYRERVLGELARRRELARQQIEQLVHGRDRLLNAFERARIAAVDVMAEMTPLGEPNEYVNLAPTTGPVPLMVPNEARPAAPADEPDATVALLRDVEIDVEVDDVEVVEVEIDDVEIDDVEIDDVEVDDVVDAPVADDEFAAEPTDELVDDEVEVDVDVDVDDDAALDAPIDFELVDDADDEIDEQLHDDGGPLAPVVSLFAGEIVTDRESRRDAEPDTDDHPVYEQSEARPSVDDLFARLRAARTDGVARRATASDEAVAEAPADDAVVVALPHVAAEAPVAEAEALAAPVDKPSVFQASPAAPADDIELDDTPFGRRDAALTPLIVASARKLKRVLADEQNDVLHILRRNEPVQSLDTLLPRTAEHVERYGSSIDGELREAAVAGAASVDDGTDHLKEITRNRAIQPALDALANTIVLPLRERLERAVSAAGGDNGELADTVRALYREWKTQRIDEHLDDVARMAFGRGALVALTPGTPVCWAVDPNGPACPDAEDNALAGVIGAGEAFPTDHTCAPAHEGCRCMLQRVPR